MGGGAGGGTIPFDDYNAPSVQQSRGVTSLPRDASGKTQNKYGPGKYDYYVDSGEKVVQKTFGQPETTLTKWIPYGMSKEGKPVIDEILAKRSKEADLISGAALEIEKKKNVASDIKRSRGGQAGAAGARQSVAAQGTILSGANQEAAGTLLGSSGNKTLLGT